MWEKKIAWILLSPFLNSGIQGYFTVRLFLVLAVPLFCCCVPCFKRVAALPRRRAKSPSLQRVGLAPFS